MSDPEPIDPSESSPEAEPPAPVSEPDGNDELRSFMEEYRADKKAAAEAAEAKAKADAEAEAKKKRVPAPEPKKKAAPKPVETPEPEAPKERSYGSSKWFNRKPKRVKE